MIGKFLCVLCFLLVVVVHAQTKSEDFRSKKITVQQDTIRIDSISINPFEFKVLTPDKKVLPSTAYSVDFAKAILILDKTKFPEILVEYYRYPDFITRVYTPFDEKLIVESTANTEKLYSETTNKKTKDIKLLEGLETRGFITRGVTTGNNQNAVTNASLDLTIAGKISDKVGIRANIFDTNFPLQQNGYSQNITDFDRIFVELYSKNWRVKGGDVKLSNTDSYFLNFEKQVSGIEVAADISKSTNALASGAVVRGKFSIFNFVGVEGNQGPYKIYGENNEAAIIIVEESETVFVNGQPLERGENKDYVMDYNLAEIRFNTKYPITNDMRIRIEFQYSDRNYTRFITYDKAQYKGDKFAIAGYFYNENDAKNQPIQQSLSEEQKQILANAGDDRTKMVAPSDFADEFSSSRIQYTKITQGSNTFFEYTTDENDDVFSVTFTNVGANNGAYVFDKTIATGTIYRYVGENLGTHSPVTQLIAPTKLQVAVVNSEYTPSEKTQVRAEFAFSDSDANLFSTIDDANNKQAAARIGWRQKLLDKKWKISSDLQYKFIQSNFQTVQRFQAVEFNRDWNLESPVGNQSELGAMFTFQNKKHSTITYAFQHLSFGDSFTGNKHSVQTNSVWNATSLWLNGSWLQNDTPLREDGFLRVKTKGIHSFGKSWLGAFVHLERNRRKEKASATLEQQSHKFEEYESFFGVGDTTKTFVKFGLNYRTNDSVRTNAFTQINNRKTLYIDSKLLQNKNTNLSVYANYRYTQNNFATNETSLNSRVVYGQRLFKNGIHLQTTYETSSGNVARQDFVYIQTEPGQGYYTWIDYNNDGEQQFNEFEIAQFQDQANYLRVPLPNLRFLPTQEVKWKQSISLNPRLWKKEKGLKKVLSSFFNQTYFSIENERAREGSGFKWNPFVTDEEDVLRLNYNFRNSLYFRRNLQNYSWIYTYGNSKNKQQFSIGNQENTSTIHQLELQHKLSKFWLLDTKALLSDSQLETENLRNRNYNIFAKEIKPSITFLYSKDHKLSLSYEYKNKDNRIADFEKLEQQKLGISYFYLSTKKNQLTADVSFFKNNFTGNANSPAGYFMLEGLQAGNNYTWNLLWNQKLSNILNLSLNYFGRKSEDTRTIHSGTIQLKAIF